MSDLTALREYSFTVGVPIEEYAADPFVTAQQAENLLYTDIGFITDTQQVTWVSKPVIHDLGEQTWYPDGEDGDEVVVRAFGWHGTGREP